MKTVPHRQLLPRLRELFHERGIPFVPDHSFTGASTVHLFVPCQPPIVVHLCAKATLGEVETLLRHRQRPKGSHLGSTQVPVVHPIFREEPTSRTRRALGERRITFEVLHDDPVDDDDLIEIADRIAERHDFLQEEQRQREELAALARKRMRVRGGGGGSISVSPPRPFDTIADVLDEMQRMVRALGEDALTATAADFGLAEDEFRWGHHPACVLHLARGPRRWCYTSRIAGRPVLTRIS